MTMASEVPSSPARAAPCNSDELSGDAASIVETALVAVPAKSYFPATIQMQKNRRTPIPPVGRVPEMAAWFRIWLAGVGAASVALLLVAACLQPNPAGLGTHQQIFGLPPCGFFLVFGHPCPSCGMTTAWALFVRGEWLSSLQANAGGFLLALAAGPLGIWCLVSAVRGRWLCFEPQPLILIAYSTTVLIATFSQWLFRG
jgi:hypothetical protein